MKRWFFVSFVLLLAACASGETFSDPVVSSKGLTAYITGSHDLENRARGIPAPYPRQGCGYSINWGDGHMDPPHYFPAHTYCVSTLNHAYARPGRYLVQIDTYDVDPIDGHVFNRRRGQQVVSLRN